MVRRSRPKRVGVLLAGGAALLSVAPGRAAGPNDWPTLGGDAGGMRYSTLSQITPANVGRLERKWVYHMKPAGAGAVAPTASEQAQAAAEQAGPRSGSGGRGRGPDGGGGRFRASEAVPLVIDGVMYLATPYGRLVALDAATGTEKWVYEVPGGDQIATRGIDYWPGDGKSPPALIFGTRGGKLISVRAADGVASERFGQGGAIDLKTPDVMVTGAAKTYGMNSPPIIWRNVVITGVSNGEAIGGAIGDIRAWDAVSGKRLWTFHTSPRKGELGYDSWANDSGHDRAGVNAWGLMTVDDKRGIVYIPVGAPANDRVGVDRPGNNLFSSSVVALDAKTGRYLWHFQIVHHDIWDNDAEAPPTLFDVRKGGRRIPAVAIESKNGMVFILDRVTGKPIFGVEERPVPRSEVPGEQTSPTQPFPVKPEPLAKMSMAMADLSTLTPEHAAYCQDLVAKNNLAMGGPYTPATYNRPMVYFPGTIGALFGGAVDPKRGLYLIDVHNLAQIQEIRPDGRGGFSNSGPVNGRFWDPKTRLLCQNGSWGDLVAINIHTGDIAWRSVLGISDNLPGDLQKTGRPTTGGPIVTAGGVTFIAATDDARFRAFDTVTGKEIWAVKLPASGHTVPISYGVKGSQYVAIVATGGSFVGSPVTSDELIVFGLK